MTASQNYFQIQTANIYIGAQKAVVDTEDVAGLVIEKSCPVNGDRITARPCSGSALATIGAWVKYCIPPVAVRAHVYPDELFAGLSAPIPFNPQSVLAARKEDRFSWAQVPGVNYSRAGRANHFVVWAQTTKDGPWLYAGSVAFTAVLTGSTTCFSDGEGSVGDPSHGEPPASCGGGLTFPATWRLEIHGLEGVYATLNNVYILKSAHSLSWENGGDGKTHCRIAMNYCGQPRCWTLLVLWNGISVTAEAAAASPFGPLHFEVHKAPSIQGAQYIVANAVSA